MWELDHKENWVPYNWCFWIVVLKSLQSSLDCKEIKPVHPKENQSRILIWRTDAEVENSVIWPPVCKELTHWKRPCCWERLKAGGEGDDRGWDGCMASPTRWTWVWVNSRSWWWTGRPGMLLQSMGSWRVRQDWATELNWTELNWRPAQRIYVCYSLLILGRAWFFQFLSRSTGYIITLGSSSGFKVLRRWFG